MGKPEVIEVLSMLLMLKLEAHRAFTLAIGRVVQGT
jgi:hypothetical protein